MVLFLTTVIAILSVILIAVVAKLNATKRREIALKKVADEEKIILQNINAYFLLINREYMVLETNYYFLNGLPEDTSNVRVGELLHCRNAIEAGECGAHAKCKLCGVRMAIGRAFTKKTDITHLNASMKLLNREGTEVIPCDVVVSGAYLNRDGEERLLLTVCDATELRNMERLLEVERRNAVSADRLKSAFIANMSHEIRTPLNAIVGFSGLMATASSEEEKQMYSDIISQNNDRLLKLVNDIFDLSQIEAGTLNFVYSEFDVNDLLRELHGIFQMKLKEIPEVDLVCEACLEPVMLHSERQRIFQVLANLLHNAMKFTKDGEVRFGYKLTEGREIRFYVADEGIGIPTEVQGKIFNSFMKLDREMPGTGLGLTLSQSIVENLGGKIGLESEVNKGSTFWFSLPLMAKKEVG